MSDNGDIDNLDILATRLAQRHGHDPCVLYELYEHVHSNAVLVTLLDIAGRMPDPRTTLSVVNDYLSQHPECSEQLESGALLDAYNKMLARPKETYVEQKQEKIFFPLSSTTPLNFDS